MSTIFPPWFRAPFVPVALACGHLVQGPAYFEWNPDRPNRVKCLEGCGWQEFVVQWDTEE